MRKKRQDADAMTHGQVSGQRAQMGKYMVILSGWTRVPRSGMQTGTPKRELA